jgi:hypothetical protein
MQLWAPKVPERDELQSLGERSPDRRLSISAARTAYGSHNAIVDKSACLQTHVIHRRRHVAEDLPAKSLELIDKSSYPIDLVYRKVKFVDAAPSLAFEWPTSIRCSWPSGGTPLAKAQLRELRRLQG